jgi:hypothetical protein
MARSMAKNALNIAFEKVRSEAKLSSQKEDVAGKQIRYGNPDKDVLTRIQRMKTCSYL